MVGNCVIFKHLFVFFVHLQSGLVLTSSNFICIFYFLWIFLGKCLHVVISKFFLYFIMGRIRASISK